MEIVKREANNLFNRIQYDDISTGNPNATRPD